MGFPLSGVRIGTTVSISIASARNPERASRPAPTLTAAKPKAVFIAGMFVKYGKEYAELCRLFGDISEADEVEIEVGQN